MEDFKDFLIILLQKCDIKNKYINLIIKEELLKYKDIFDNTNTYIKYINYGQNTIEKIFNWYIINYQNEDFKNIETLLINNKHFIYDLNIISSFEEYSKNKHIFEVFIGFTEELLDNKTKIGVGYYIIRNFLTNIYNEFYIKYIKNREIVEIKPWFFENRDIYNNFIDINELRMTKESVYSVTHWIDAKNITLKIIELIGKNITITDATANVGGNTISFAKYGIKNINSVEIDYMTCKYLSNNIQVYNIEKQVKVYCDNYLNIKFDLEQDCIFFDPPWGGPDYYKEQKMNLFLMDSDNKNINIIDIIKSLLEKNKAKLIVVKVPTNYNFDLLKNIGYKYNRQPIYKKANRVVYEIIYIFNY